MTRICLFFACLSLHTAFGQSMFVGLDAGIGRGIGTDWLQPQTGWYRDAPGAEIGYSLGMQAGIHLNPEYSIGTGLAKQWYQLERTGISDLQFSMLRMPLYLQWNPLRKGKHLYPIFKIGVYGSRGELYENYWPEQTILGSPPNTKPFILVAPEKYREAGIMDAIGLCWGSASGWDISFELNMDFSITRFGAWNQHRRNLTFFGLFSLKKRILTRK